MQTLTNDTLGLPSWLLPDPDTLKKDKRELELARFKSIFESVIDELSGGAVLSIILRDNYPDVAYGSFLRWVMTNPDRKNRYYEAQEIGTEALADEAMVISDGRDTLEDTARSALRIETRWKAIRTRNKARYGDTKQIDINTTHTVSIKDLLAKRDARLIEGEVVKDQQSLIEDATIVDNTGNPDD